MAKLDVVVFGATGFTGGLAAEWLALHHPERKVGLSGRNIQKLQSLRDALSQTHPVVKEWPLIVANADKPDELRAMVERTKVVISTVGPFFLYGQPLVAACVEAGTDYTDLTGEPHFMAKMIDLHHERAVETGARIVHASGFDSLPSDLGTLFLQNAAMKEHGAPAPHVRMIVEKIRGAFSGGTIHTVMDSVEQAVKDKDIRRAMAKPYSLCTEKGAPIRTQQKPEFDSTTNRWTAPFLMAPTNEKVVRRSHELLGFPWGKSFTYDEAMDTGKGTRGRMRAWSVAAGLGLGAGMFSVSPLRKLSKRVLPAPGDGPAYDERMAGFFRLLFSGYVDGKLIQARVHGQMDPGYGATAGMIGETAIALADIEGPGGIHTTASSLGTVLIDRLSAKHLKFEVV